MPVTYASPVLTHIFGEDPRARILTEDDRHPFPRGKSGIPFLLMSNKKMKYSPFAGTLSDKQFSGLNGMFKLLAPTAGVSLQVWFSIRGQGDNRQVDIRKADMIFSRPWGGYYFFYCRDDSPATYHLTPMPIADELRASSGWCARNANERCGDHVCCDRDPMEDYFEYVSPSRENWQCNGIKYIHIDRLVIGEDGPRALVEARLRLRVNPASPLLPRFNVSREDMDISEKFYGALILSGVDDYFQKHNRPGDITATLESFFLTFGAVPRVETRAKK